jgi:hypothetical protein
VTILDWQDVGERSKGIYLEAQHRGMHCELFYNNRLGHAPMGWDWSFYDDDTYDPDLAVARNDDGFLTIEDAEADLIDYIRFHIEEKSL